MTFTSFLQLLVLALLISGSFCALRFDDEEMLKKHHSEKYPKDGATLTVHLIPHSHDDVGWLKTVDDYYYGGDMRTQFAGVQYTIDTVVQELTDHPEYKFSIVEMAFLYRWWHQATDKEKTRMKTLVANGQL
jgi:lysosomal alpha-mannosidase